MNQPETKHLFRRDGGLTELTLDRYRLGDLTEDERQAVARRLDEQPEVRAVLQAMDEFDSAHELRPPAALVAAIAAGEARPPKDAKVLQFRRRMRVGAPVALGLLAAAAAVSLVAPTNELSPGPAVVSGDDFRVKGAGFGVELHAHDGAESRRLAPGASVRPGERLGFRVEGGSGGHLLIAGIDAKHDPYLCYPQDTGGASALAPEGKEAQVLNAAVRLDDAPGVETVVAVLCDAPFAYGEIAAAMRQALVAGGELPTLKSGCVQRVIPLTKVAP